MSDQAEGDQRELEAIQRQLADTRQHIGELEALIGELPAIYERKFEQQLQPLLEQERLLLQQNLLLRDQLLRALPGHGAQLLLPPSQAQAPVSPSPGPVAVPVPGQGQEANPEPAANPDLGPDPNPEPNPDPGANAQPATLFTQGPQRPPAEPQPAQPFSALAAAPGSAPVAPPQAPEPPRPQTSPEQGQGSSKAAAVAERQQPPYRLALLATVVALGAFGLARPWGAKHKQRADPPQGTPQATAAPGSVAQATSSQNSSTEKPGGTKPIELLVITSGPSWIELRDQRGQTIYASLLEGQKRFRLGTGLSLKAGRPELVQVQLGSAPVQFLPPGEWWTWHRFQPPGA